jgi:tetratricopeptide (TPR) repeat protein
MTDHDRPNLALGQPPGELKHRLRPLPPARGPSATATRAAALAALIAIWLRPAGPAASSSPAATAQGGEHLRQIALGLEERGLSAQAARAWQDVLAVAPDAPDRAEILYRAGRLCFDAGSYDEAAAVLVRAEMAAGDDRQLRTQIGRKLVDALRRGGRYGEVGRELSRQVELGGGSPGRGKVLATLAGEELTESDLDRMVERRVDDMLQMQGASDNAAARDALLKQLAEPAVRHEMLQELIQTELFARRARELKLDQQEDFLRARDAMAESLLAGRFLADRLAGIQPTLVDLESYYKANHEKYLQPAEIEAVLIGLVEGEDHSPLLDQIASAEDFRKLAAEHQAEAAPRRIVRGRPDPLLGTADELFELAEGEWTKTPLVHNGQRWLALVDRKTAERTPPLEEVLDRIRADYVARKQAERAQELLADLMSRYDVQIIPPGEKEPEPASNKNAEP